MRPLIQDTLRHLRSRQGRVAVVAWGILLMAYFALLEPMLRDFDTYGFHDWDAHAAYRHITTLSLTRYREGPWWHPWLCGGVPAFGYVEGAPNLVSPYLPFYLLLDIRTALRLEVVGNGLIALVGAYLLARRFTRSGALSALFAALFVLNGRWALQTAVGHTWHLQYAFTPWVFYFFERGLTREKLHFGALAGACLAMMCFSGGIYPLPQTALLLSVHAISVALLARSRFSLRLLVVTGFTAIGLSAPKLFAVADYLSDSPRLIESREVVGPSELLVMLTDRAQRYGAFPVRVPAYNWHEWGIYIGVGGSLCLAAALLFARGVRGQAFKICGGLCLLLGFGAFHELSPWALLHRLPPFASQHVPSRFHYLMLFFLGLAFVTLAARFIDPLIRRKPWLDWALLVPLVLFSSDLSLINRVPFEQAFWMRAPADIERNVVFEHRTNAEVAYLERDWSAPMLLAMFANTGVIRCYGADTARKIGALAADAPGYRGESFILSGPGTTQLLDWSPNRAVVRVSGAQPGSLLAYNMNYDSSWRANGEPAIDAKGLVVHRLTAANQVVTFSYFPRSLKFSVPLTLLTLALVFGHERIRRFGRRLRRDPDQDRRDIADPRFPKFRE